MENTVDYVVHSSLHGRDRRQLRDISKLSLQKAVKYGRKEKCNTCCPLTGKHRWKFTFADIVYITDYTCTTEVTSFVLPIEIDIAQVSEQEISDHQEAIRQISANPQICTSHTILVVDQSRSMKTSDVVDFRNRSDAAYGTLALDFVAKQIDHGATWRDVVSLVEMNDEARVVFHRAPIDKLLFNQLVNRRKRAIPRSHGNFRNSIASISRMLNPERSNSSCAILVLFLSDGRPSDNAVPGMPGFIGDGKSSRRSLACIDALHPMLHSLASTFGKQLTFGTIGFGVKSNDFVVLQGMSDIINTSGGCGIYQHSSLCSSSLASSITTLSKRLTQTKISLSVLSASKNRIRKMVMQDYNFNGGDARLHKPITDHDWIKYHSVKRYTVRRYRGEGPTKWTEHQLCDSQATGAAIRSRILGEGAERIVYQFSEISRIKSAVGSILSFVGPPLVAKESRFVNSEQNKMEFHKIFCLTQQESYRIANKFNEKLSQLYNLQNSQPPAVISFLECTVYEMPDENDHDNSRGLLVEKMLDQTLYRKWNSNNGHVVGRKVSLAASPKIVVGDNIKYDKEKNNIQVWTGDVEKDSSSSLSSSASTSSSSYDSDDSEARDVVCDLPLTIPTAREKPTRYQSLCTSSHKLKSSLQQSTVTSGSSSSSFDDSEFLQAFSHYSYRYTQRKLLVCDLQGVFNRSEAPMKFELTDPVIHYSSHKGRSRVFGRTDHGQEGILNFFNSHFCGQTCLVLGIAGYKR